MIKINQDKEKILKDVQHNDIGSLQELKAAHPDFHWCTISYPKTGDTALHLAARLGHLTTINYLLDEYTPSMVDIKNKDDKTPLHDAAQFTQLDSVLRLCCYGADVNALRRGDWTPLMLACTKIQPGISFDIAKKLVNCGAVINMQNKDGWSCVHLLAREGGVDVFNYLLTCGLNVNVKTKNGRTALHIAALHGQKDIVIKLIYHIDLNCKDGCGNTPLHEAILGQHIKLARFLVATGANIQARNNSDFNVLHLAASQDNVKVLDYVLNELKLDCDCRNLNGWTPAHCAARNGCKKVFEHLRRLGADIYQKDVFGRTPLDYLKL